MELTQEKYAQINALMDEAEAHDEIAGAIAKEVVAIYESESGPTTRLRDLAEAVLAFAEWHEQGYSTDESRRVGELLWMEVSDGIYSATGRRPPSLGPGAEGSDGT
jgi:hypothetical protein